MNMDAIYDKDVIIINEGEMNEKVNSKEVN